MDESTQLRPKPVSPAERRAAAPTGAGSQTPAGSTRFRSLSDPESLREFAKNLREGIYITTRDGQILDANAAFLEIAGVASLAELGKVGAVGMYADPERRKEQLRRLETDGSVREFEIALQRPDGQTRTVLDSCHLVRDPDTGEAFIHGILIDITSRKVLEASLVELSTHDPLTGALNRRCLTDIEAELARDPSAKCGCIFVDIDHFKLYNDHHGHLAGDACLQRVAGAIKGCANRASDLVARYGGEEFAAILPNAADTTGAMLAEKMRASVAALALPHSASGTAAFVTISVGVATLTPQRTTHAVDLIAAADRALYQAKESGRNRVVCEDMETALTLEGG